MYRVPARCRIKIENGIVSGNGCKEASFAVSETTCPMRSVCSTVATTFKDYPVLPVRTDGEIPKDKIDELMKQINAVVVSENCIEGTWCSKAYAARTSTSSQRQAFIENGAQSGRENAMRL